MWTPLLNIKDKPSNKYPDRGMLKIVYWCRDERKYKYVGCRYGCKKSKDKAYEIMAEKRAELKKLLTYDGKDRVIFPQESGTSIEVGA